jgi:hypothetical protein
MNRGSTNKGADVSPSEQLAREKHMRRLAWLMDESIRLPGGFRIGIDGLLGLIPGIGDLSGAALSSYVIYQARMLGAPRSLLIRMGVNVVLEAMIGAIPIIGDLFDFYFKANSRNVRLLNEYFNQPKPTVRKSRAAAAGWVLVGLIVVLAAVAIPVLLVVALFQALA